MAKAKHNTKPIMTRANERFLAFEGMLEWLQGVQVQNERLTNARGDLGHTTDRAMFRQRVFQVHLEAHFFVVAAYKVWEHKNWVVALRICKAAEFAALRPFFNRDLRDLRNMKEHGVEYFRGRGRVHDRWVKSARWWKSDASAMTGPRIGGRLDYIAFSAAAAAIYTVMHTRPPLFFPIPARPGKPGQNKSRGNAATPRKSL